MTKILIICKEQFGYHTDIYKWCEYLRDLYDIKVITLSGRSRIELSGIQNVYVSGRGGRTIRGIRFIFTSLWHILFFKGIILVCHFGECGILKKCFPRKKMILDIRTLGISSDPNIRLQRDSIIKKNTNTFDYVTIISEGLRRKLSLPIEKSSILPLGADTVSDTIKTFDSLKLLYVGTLFNRDVHKTIEGLDIAIKVTPEIDIHYDIIGDGFGNELEELKELVAKKELDRYVTFHGYIPHTKLKTYLDSCNIGVSFVPKTEYYEHQPVTKTFEYVLSGLYTIATNTFCNKEIITKQNGILIDDTPEAFANAITSIYNNRNSIESEKIRGTLTSYLWKNIVRKKMVPILEQFYRSN